MIDSTYNRYRKQLTALATDDVILAAIAAGGAGEHDWLPRDLRWTRIHGRFNPGLEPFAKLVFESQETPQIIFHAEIFRATPIKTSRREFTLFEPTLGWIRLLPFPSDRVLHTLGSLITGQEKATVVRYRPGRRCTIQLNENGHSRFVKVYPKKFGRQERGEDLYTTGIALWEACVRGELNFAVAKPEAWDEQARTLWQYRIAGTPVLPQLLGSGGQTLAHRIGSAAASLPTSTLKPRRLFDGAAQLSASIKCGAELRERLPHLASSIRTLLIILQSLHDSRQSRSLRPIHGDLDAGQWLDDGTQLGLTDFDDFALGDPELDAATFLAELEFESEAAANLAHVSEAFLEAYELAAGPLDRLLLRAYLAHKRLYKALRVARALIPDGDVRAERYVKESYDALFKLCPEKVACRC